MARFASARTPTKLKGVNMSKPCAPCADRSFARLLLLLIGLLLWQQLASASPPEAKSRTEPYYYEPLCGDWACSVGEDCSSCPEDCGSCSEYCGDGICQSSESCTSCSYDCGSCSENRSVVVNGKRYWADYASNAIWRSNL